MPPYFSKRGAEDPDEDAGTSAIGFLVLLLLLLLLAALADEGTDAYALIQDFIQWLLDSLKGS